jgi:23S rRNA pseudouridine1911/1915/1917 synthase
MRSEVVSLNPPEHTFIHQVSTEHDSLPVRTVLSRGLELSRQLLVRLKRSGTLLINGEPALLKDRVRAGDILSITIKEEKEQDLAPEPLSVSVVFEDDHVLVLDKSPGMVVHPTKGFLSGTVANAVIHHWQERGQSFVFRPVHRLDKDTSGLLVIAKNPFVQDALTRQHQSGEWHKSYTAVVQGEMRDQSGRIEAPIARVGNGTRARIIADHGQRAVTLWETLRILHEATLIKARLVTGRTHQIRVHMAHIGHPLIGDEVYGTPTELIGRHALHASAISFTHPVTKAHMYFTSALPEDMRALIEKAQRGQRPEDEGA